MRTGVRALLAIVCVVASCVPPPDPVATVSVSPTSLPLLYSEVRTVDFEFRILAPLGEEFQPRVFVHLYAKPGDVLRTFDHPFPGKWQPGASVHRRLRIHQSALGPPLREGRYFLSVGLYDVERDRWPLQVRGLEIDRMEYQVAEIVVSEPSAVPMFRFSEAWKPIEAGLDRQILGRRWLVDRGSIWVTEASEVRSIWMLLQVPAPVAGVSRLALEPGAEKPGVIVRSECGGTEIELTGAGRHEVDLPVRGQEAGGSGECQIALRPNFRLLENGAVERRTVLLEALAWSAGEE